MHPFLAQPRWLVLYLLIFLQAGVLLAEILLGGAVEHRFEMWLLILPLFLIHAFSSLASWFLCRALPLGKMPLVWILASQAGSTILASAGVVFLGWFGAGILTAEISGRFEAGLLLVFIFSAFSYSLMVVLHYLFAALDESRQAQKSALEAAVLAREAELQSLRAQLDPHFLFNSLSSVSALVTSDPKQAREMCSRLAMFFRRTLELGAEEMVTLSDEIQLIQDYLAIEQSRFGERLSFEIDVDPEAEPCELPPLILQPLVENAVRHGIGHLLEGGEISLKAARQRGDLLLKVENPCDPDRPKSRGAGIGLVNVRRRLSTVYGGDAGLDSVDRPESFTASLRIPVNRPSSTITKESLQL